MLFLSGCATNNVAEEVLRVFIEPDGSMVAEWY
jgi:hypothetical protein